MLSTTASVAFLVVNLPDRPLKRILLRNVIPPFLLTALLIPSQFVPVIPHWLLWMTVGCLFSWLGVVVGGSWMKIPEGFANAVAPLWIVTSLVLGKLGVPWFLE